MKARLTIDIDADDVPAVVEHALSDLRWSLLNKGSSNEIGRLWAEAQSSGCDIAMCLNAGRGWDAQFVMTTRQDIGMAVEFVKEGENE